MRDFPAAASWYEKAIAADPNSPELINRTFVMEISVGRFEKARPLAERQLKLEPSMRWPKLVLLTDRLRAGDANGALKYATTQCRMTACTGSSRRSRWPGAAWRRATSPAPRRRCRGSTNSTGFAPLKSFQLGAALRFRGQAGQGQGEFRQGAGRQRAAQLAHGRRAANFHERQGQADEAQALYKRFLQQNTGSELAQSVLAARPPGPPPAPIGSAADGLAEAMFDLASVLNQAETIDLALVYSRFALELRPDLPLAQLLLADVLSAQNKPDQSLAVLESMPARARPIRGRRGCASPPTSTRSTAPTRRSPS